MTDKLEYYMDLPYQGEAVEDKEEADFPITAWREIPRRSASCSWLSPARFRQAWIFSDSVMRNHLVCRMAPAYRKNKAASTIRSWNLRNCRLQRRFFAVRRVHTTPCART